MSQQNDTPFVSLKAGEALEAFRRVKMSGTTARTLVYADAGEDFIGITQAYAASGADVNIKSRFAPGTFKVTVSADTVAANAVLYGADDGKVSTTINGAPCFIGLERGTSNGAIIESNPFIDVPVTAFDWQDSVKDYIDFTAAEPAAPTLGDRYLNSGSGASSETAQTVAANELLIYNGTNWTRITPTKGMAVMTEDDNEILVFTTSWVNLQTLNQAANVAAMVAITAAAAALTATDPAAMTAAAAALTATDPAAMTAAAAALTATDPAAMTAAAAALTYADPAAMTSPTAGNGSGADATTFSGAQCDALRADVDAIRTKLIAAGADLGTQKGILDALITDVTAIRTKELAAIADLGTQKGILDALITDVTAIRTKELAAIADLGTQKGILDAAIADVTAARTTLNAEIAALKTAGLQASS